MTDLVGKSTKRSDGFRLVGSCGKVADWCLPSLEDDFCPGCPINIGEGYEEDEEFGEREEDYDDD